MQANKAFPFDLGYAFSTLFTYLNMSDQVRLASTCTLLRKTLMKNTIWQTFTIEDFHLKQESIWTNFLKWVRKYLMVIKPQRLVIHLMNIDRQEDELLIKILSVQKPFIQTLNISVESMELHVALAVSCPNTTELLLHSKEISDELFQMMHNKMENITKLHLLSPYSGFTGRGLQSYTKVPFEKLILKPYQLNFESIALLLKNEFLNEINEFQMDAEQCNEQHLVQIIDNLKHIRRLRICHMETKENPDYFWRIATILQKEMSQLVLTKCHHIQMHQILKKISSVYLQSIDLTEAFLLRDQSVFLLSQKCINLKIINLSWCNKVTNKSVEKIIQKCLRLQKITLTGMKSLTDDAFREYSVLKQDFLVEKYDKLRQKFIKECKQASGTSEQDQIIEKYKIYSKNQFFFKNNEKILVPKRTLRNLRVLECISCNHISDIILKIICCFSRMTKAYNYYNEEVSLLRNEDEQRYI